MFYLFYRELHPDQKEDLKKLRNHLISSSSELAALKVWELQGQFLTSANNTVQLWFDYSFSVLGGEIFSPPYSFLQKTDRGFWTMTMQIQIHWEIKKKKTYSKLQSLGVYASFKIFLFVDGRFKLSDRSESSECWPRGADKGSPGLQPELPIQN